MRLALCIVAGTLALGGPAAAASGEHSLARDGEAFWSGPGTPAGDCGAGCWEYGLDVRDAGARLRVGIDHATDGDVWTLQALPPPGQGAATSVSPGTGLYSEELIVNAAPAGRWRIRVTGDEVADRRFRIRAKLEATRPAFAAGEPVLPNLQALPPYELSFDFPITNGGGIGGDVPVGASLPGGRLSCHVEEVLLEGATRCLRMAFGVRNTGRGPMWLFYDDPDAGAPWPDQVLRQRVPLGGGGHADRVAGSAVYHHTHQHYHHAKAIALTLWRVTDPAAGGLVAAAPEHLKGFAHRNELMREWPVFYPLWTDFGFGLRAGWGDYYEWDRPGNYVDFAANADGRYVLRIVADPVGGILESNESDNTSYSLIDVAGTAVTLLETGRGTDPWDRCKIVMPVGAEPDLPPGQVQPLRPPDCPPDTSGLPAPAAAPAPVARKPAKRAAKKRKAKPKRRCKATKRTKGGKRTSKRRCKRPAPRRPRRA